MPAGLLPNVGLSQQILSIVKGAAPTAVPWQLLFFVNDITPDADTVIEDLTEATWGGYDRIDLDVDEWTTPDVMDGCAHVSWGEVAQVMFVTSGPIETNYGVAYVDPTTNELIFVQRFDEEDIEPVTIGGRVSILPQYTLTSAECG